MGIKVIQVWFGVLSIVFLSACTQPIRPSSKMDLGTEQVFDKNYTIGQKQVAYVGQPILKVKDYKVRRFSSKQMRASDDFVISGGIVTIMGTKNTDYDVAGETTLDGKTYTAVKLPGGQGGLKALIDADGRVHDKVLNNAGGGSDIVMVYTFKTSPTDLRFDASKEEKKIIDSGYLNYEFIYGGTDGKSLTFTYREFTSGDLARPAFFQNLVYEAGKQQIRYKDTLMNIHEATNEKVVYTVISDGLSR